ncbi:MAG: hypothetical protein OXS29_14770 [bacterium]|nr:hypothetical protein [bacterium]MDE0289326.1 hypothetical protein [bacterium]MDE0439397.1 hypothetical protein [bacterium]
MTVVQEDAVADRVAQALEFIAQAEAEFAVGDTRQAAEKLYGASVQAVIAASIQRGWDYNSHRANKNATRQLADQYEDPFLSTGFTAAEKFHIHFHHGGMEDYQITADRHDVRSYVERMLKLVEEHEANRKV